MSFTGEQPTQRRGRGRPRGVRPAREEDFLQEETEFRNCEVVRVVEIIPGRHDRETVMFRDGDEQMPSSPSAADDAAQPSPPQPTSSPTYSFPGDYGDQWQDMADQGGAGEHDFSASNHAHLLRDPARCPLVHVESSRQGMWCVPHYVESGHALSRYHFSMVHLRAIGAVGEYWLVSWCTCSGTASVAEILLSAQDLERDFSEAVGDLQPCACATALCAALGVGNLWQPCGQDALERHLHPDAAGAPKKPVISDDVLTVCISVNGAALLAVRLGDSLWGLVANYSPTAAGQLRCLLCRKSHCPHTSALDAGEGCAEVRMDDAAFEVLLAQHFDPLTGKRRVTSLSQQPVPEEGLSGAFDDIRAADIVGARMSGLVQLPCSFGPSCEACSCGCGGAVWEECELCVCTVFGLTFMQDATWHKLRCSACGIVRDYDGSEDCLLLQTSFYVFTWEFLMRYSAAVTSNEKVTFYGFWLDHLRIWHLAGATVVELQRLTTGHVRNMFQEAWFNFITLQDLHYLEVFDCCSGRSLVADGVMLSFKLKRAHMERPWAASADAAVVEAPRFADRLPIPDPGLRKLLLSFCGGRPPPQKPAADSGLERAGLQELIRQLRLRRHAKLRCLLPMLEHPEVDSGRSRANARVRELLYNLSTPASACQHLPPALYDVVDAVLGCRALDLSAEPTHKFLEHSPALFKFLKSCGLPLPEHVLRLLEHLRTASIAAYPAEACDEEEERSDDGMPLEREDGSSFYRTCQWFGASHQVRRRVRKYAADERRAAAPERCTKHAYRSGKMVPGLFVVWCLDCNRCMGFSVMQDKESPRTPFEVLLTRWEQAPEVFVYDNGCNHAHFCLNREPAFFRSMQQLIDAMHYKGHTSCPTSFDITRVSKERRQGLRNSQLAEQQNAKLGYIVSQAAYMTQFNFLDLVRYFLYRRNRREAAKQAGVTSLY